MIADTLYDAVNEIDDYLKHGADVYGDGGNLAIWVMTVRDSMELLRCRLDCDTQGNQPEFRIYSDPDPDPDESDE